METNGKYRVTVMVTVDLEAFNSDMARYDALDVVNDALDESSMREQGLRVTGIARDDNGEMIYCYGVAE